MGNLLHPLGALAAHSSSSWCGNAKLVLNQPSSEGRNGAWRALFPSLGLLCVVGSACTSFLMINISPDEFPVGPASLSSGQTPCWACR